MQVAVIQLRVYQPDEWKGIEQQEFLDTLHEHFDGLILNPTSLDYGQATIEAHVTSVHLEQ